MNKLKIFIKKYKTGVIVFFVSLIIMFLSYFGFYKCPFKYIFGISCPFCGMTRAFYSLFSLKIHKSFYYHALWPLFLISLLTYFILKIKKVKINKKLENGIMILIALTFLTYYIIRNITGSPVVKVEFGKSLIYKIYLFIFR